MLIVYDASVCKTSNDMNWLIVKRFSAFSDFPSTERFMVKKFSLDSTKILVAQATSEDIAFRDKNDSLACRLGEQ